MSPEQALGRQLDTRTDLFSFGILLYEMCTSHSPFAGDTTGELLISIVQQVQITPAQLNPDVPKGLASIIDRCLEKDRELRYQHAAEIRADLKKVQSNSAEVPPLRRQIDSSPEVPSVVPTLGRSKSTPRWRWLWTLSGLGIVGVALLAVLMTRPLPVPMVSHYVQLTRDGQPKGLVGTDGSRLYLGFGRPTANNATSGIMQMSISGGEPVRIPAASRAILPLGVSQDGAALLVKDNRGTEYRGELWRLPILGGTPTRLDSLVGQDGAWSPDGGTLVYADGSDLFLARGDGTESRKLVSLPGRGFYPAWSPSGNELRLTVIDFRTNANSLWEVSKQGTNLHPLFTAWHNASDACCGKWTADGKYFVFQSQSQIWARAEKGTFLHQSTGRPIQLTSSPLGLFTPLPSKDGKKLFVAGRTYRGELERGDSKSGQFTPILSGISAEDVVFSKDLQWVAYVSYPEGILWKSKLDGSGRVQLSTPPLLAGLPRWSPDGKQIAFFDALAANPERSTSYQPPAATPGNCCPKIPSLSEIRTGRGTETRFSSVAYQPTTIQFSACST